MTEPAQSADYVAPSGHTVGSLFSGIGGLELGLERTGFRVIWQAEVDPYASQVLAKHWPDVPNLGDVTVIDWSTIERPDLLCGGFPCQPVSEAGQRLAQADERWLWPEVARAVRHLRPEHVLVENVPGLLTAGMGDVLGDLAALGYDTEWESFPAAAVGAPHLRYRVFILAHAIRSDAQGGRGSPDSGHGGSVPPAPRRQPARSGGGQALAHPNGKQGSGWREQQQSGGEGAGDVAHPNGSGPQGHGRPGERPGELAPAKGGSAAGTGTVAHAERPGREGITRTCERAFIFAEGNQAIGGVWEPEPDVGRVAHGVPSRVDRLRCLGNAVVPQVAEWLGRQLVLHIDGDVGA